MSKARVIQIIILTILISSVGSIIFLYYFNSSEKLTAEIYQDGNLLYSIDLANVTDSYEITIPGLNNSDSFNTILVERNTISMTNASCPDHICVKTGKITSPLVPITCLPNKVVIRIIADSEENLDSIAY